MILRKSHIVGIVLILALFWSCKKAEIKPDYSLCRFDFDPTQAKLQWTAYKFTERLGVSGTFNSIRTENARTATKPEEVFAEAEFIVDAASVNTNNPDRDKKIYYAFFAAMKNKGEIRARVESVSANNATLLLKINGIEKKVSATVRRVDGAGLEVAFRLDIAEFNALSPLAALNLACKDLHKGKDGQSKLWPDIDVKITAKLSPVCPG